MYNIQEIQTRTRQSLLLILFFTILLIVGACATKSETQLTPAPAIDEPPLSSQDAIAIAKQHSVTSPQDFYERQAGIYAQRGGTQGWSATYSGNGKWTVELRLRSEDESITIYRWSVFETNLAAVYLGAYEGN